MSDSSLFGLVLFLKVSTLNSLRGCWRSTAIAAWGSISIEIEVAPPCLNLCDPIGCSLSRSSIHGIFQARVLEWVAISFSRGSSRPRDRSWVSRIVKADALLSEPPGKSSRSIGVSQIHNLSINCRVLNCCTCHFQSCSPFFDYFGFLCLQASSESNVCPDTRGQRWPLI